MIKRSGSFQMHTKSNLEHGSTILLIHEKELASFLHHPQPLKKYLFKIDIERFIDMVFVKKIHKQNNFQTR